MDTDIPKPNRALPQWAVDLMVFGVDDKTARDPRKVWTQILRIAMSAYRRGWTEFQFTSELAKTDRSARLRRHRLWTQLYESCSDRSAYRQLHKAWDCAEANINNVGERTIGELRADAVERAYQWVDRITENHDGLTIPEAAVLGYVVAETEQRRMTRVTCPVRAVAEFAKVSAMTASRTLNSLAAKGFLTKHSPGRVSKEPGNRRAAIYGLADPELLRFGGLKTGACKGRGGRGT